MEPESPDGERTRDLENPRMEKELRVSKKGAGGDTREGNLTRNVS